MRSRTRNERRLARREVVRAAVIAACFLAVMLAGSWLEVIL